MCLATSSLHLAVRRLRRWRFPAYHCSSTVSLFSVRLPEYMICLGSHSFPILWTYPDHLRFFCIRMSYITHHVGFSSTAAFGTKSYHFIFRICPVIVLYMYLVCVQQLCTQFRLNFRNERLAERSLCKLNNLFLHTLALSCQTAFEMLEVWVSSSWSSLLLLLMV